MASKATLDLELVPLLKALKNRIDALRSVQTENRDGVEIHSFDGLPFMQLEKRRDHMLLDLWLSSEKLEEARASGIARAHPFMESAVRVRFERAEDLTRVAHWLEEAYRFVPVRKDRANRPPEPAPVSVAPPAIEPAPTAPTSPGAATTAVEAPSAEPAADKPSAQMGHKPPPRRSRTR